MYQEPPDDGLKNGHAELIVKYSKKFKNFLRLVCLIINIMLSYVC